MKYKNLCVLLTLIFLCISASAYIETYPENCDRWGGTMTQANTNSRSCYDCMYDSETGLQIFFCDSICDIYGGSVPASQPWCYYSGQILLISDPDGYADYTCGCCCIGTTTTTTIPLSATTTRPYSTPTTTLSGGDGEETWIFDEDDDGGLDCCYGIPVIGGILGGVASGVWDMGGSALGGGIGFCDYNLKGLLLAFICLSIISLAYLKYVKKIKVDMKKFIVRLPFIISTVCLWLAVVSFICSASFNFIVILALVAVGIYALKYKIKILKDVDSVLIFGVAGLLLTQLLKYV